MMSVVKVIEIMSSSEKSWEDATKRGIAKAATSIKGMKSAWVKDQSVSINKGKVKEFRVTLKITFEIK